MTVKTQAKTETRGKSSFTSWPWNEKDTVLYSSRCLIIYFSHFSKLTQVKAETWPLKVISIILFLIECDNTQSLINKKKHNCPNTYGLDCKSYAISF